MWLWQFKPSGVALIYIYRTHFVLKITSKNINPEDYRLDIYNQLGQRVFKQENFINRLDLQFLSKGVYFLKIKNKNKRVLQSFKIIKE